MPATALVKNSKALQVFLGEDLKVNAVKSLPVSRIIEAEVLDVIVPDNVIPEEKASLYLFPIADNTFYLQLLYMQYAEGKSSGVTVHSLKFSPEFFEQYPADVLSANRPFRFDETTEQQLSMCSTTRSLLDNLQKYNTALTAFSRSLQQSETAMQLLRRALDCMTVPFSSCQVPACRFLAYDSERDKIQEARTLIEQRLDQPMTIKELSRKVAMNECYLKKGFKALVGKTIHEYQQELRIAKAKELLQENGQSVSDVSAALGYSSISHFSTAFKKATGLKPCELLK